MSTDLWAPPRRRVGNADLRSPVNAPRTASAGCAGTILAFLVGVLALVQVFCLWSGALGIRLDNTLAMVFGGAALAGGLVLAWRLHPRSGAEPLPEGPALERDLFSQVLGWVLALPALGLTAAAAVRLAKLAWLRAPCDWDGLYYHLPAMSGWAEVGRVCWLDNVPDLPFANGYPMGLETLCFFVQRLLGTSSLVDGGNLFFWPLAVIGLHVIARWVGLRGGWAWLPAGLMASAPTFLAQSATCYVDPAYTSALIAAIAATGLVVFHDGRGIAAKLVLAGAACGLVLGLKGTGIAHALLLIAAMAMAGRIMRPKDGSRAWLGRMVVMAGVMVVVGGYWMARNVLMTGNPVFPVGVTFGGVTLWPGLTVESLSIGNLPHWMANWPAPLRPILAWLQTDAPITGFDLAGGLGFLWPAGLLATILVTWQVWRCREEDATFHPVIFLVATTTVLLLVQPAAWWARYTLWLHALGLPCLALALARGVAAWRHPVGRASLCALATGCLAIGVWEGRIAVEFAEHFNLDTRPGRDGRYLEIDERYFGLLRTIEGSEQFMAAPVVGRSRWGRIGMLFGGVLAMPLGQRQVIFVDGSIDSAGVERLRQRGVTWVAWEVTGAGPVPASLTSAASRVVHYKPGADFELHLLQL